MKKFSIQSLIFILVILFSNISFSQSENEYLKERILNSEIVIEGEVISKDAFWDNSQNKIYTDNKIKVFKVFKGRVSTDTISIITKGGIMEDHFLILSHHPDFSVGMKGVFFCENNNFESLLNKHSNQLKIYGGEDSFIRYYDDGVNPAAADKKRTYKNIRSELYPALQLFSKQKTKSISPNLKEQQINKWLKSNVQIGVNKSPDNSPESPETETNIEFEFSNVTINSLGELDFDILAKTNQDNILLGEASVFIAYNPSVFGANVVNNNVVEVSKSTIIQDSNYQLESYDFDNSTVQIDAIGDCRKDANLYLMALEFEEFCHVKISISDWTQLANLSFDDFKMDGNMKYFDEQRNECVDFDEVIVSDPINTFSNPTADISIEYNLRNVEVTNSGGSDFLEFDITAKASEEGTMFSFAEIFINFNTSTFGSNVTDNGNLLVIKNASFLNSSYSALFLDESGGTAFGIDIVSVGTDNLVELPNEETELVHIKLTIQDCNTPANINFDEIAMLTGSTHFVGDGMPIPHETYFPVNAEDEINSALCPANTPVILNFYPKVITAGTKSVLTIEGNNFGSIEGLVMFQNADDGGMSMMKALSPDFLTGGWSNSKIQLYVPSNEGSTTDPAGSGNFVVQTSGGTPATSPLPLDIPYAVGNFRDGNDVAHRFEMIDDNGSGGYTFHRSTNMDGVNSADIDNSIEWALDEWNCETGVTWNLDIIPSDSTDQNSSDGINLIYFAPDSQFSGDAVAFNSASGIINRQDDCTNGEGERVSWFVDIDIAIKESITWNFPLGSNPGMNTQDFPSVILHELGHAHRLDHSIPREKIMYWMLDQNPPTTSNSGFQIHRDLHPADINGGIDVLNSSQVRFDGGNCSNVTPIKILKTCTTGIEELENKISLIKVYPNPILDNFQVELRLKTSIDITVEVFDILGRNIHIEKLGKLGKGNHSFPIIPKTKLFTGTYLVNIKGDNQFLSTFKIVKL